MILSLGNLVYVQHLRSANERLDVQLTRAKLDLKFKDAQIETDAKVRAADDERASKAEAELTAFKEKADAEIARLKHPDRLCLDGDDTDRVRAIFRNPLR